MQEAEPPLQKPPAVTSSNPATPPATDAAPAAGEDGAGFVAKPPMVGCLRPCSLEDMWHVVRKGSQLSNMGILWQCTLALPASNQRSVSCCDCVTTHSALLLVLQVPDEATVTGAHVPVAPNAPAGVEIGKTIGADEVRDLLLWQCRADLVCIARLDCFDGSPHKRLLQQ